MPETAFRETTTPLLRPHQTEKHEAELRRLEETLAAPPHIASQIQNRADLTRSAKNLRRMIDTQKPLPYAPAEKDKAVRRAAELEGEIAAGMLSHAEMRRNPPGAVDQHRRWERRNKRNIDELKNIKLRLHATGDSPDRLEDERDVANIEHLRPADSRMNLDTAQITRPDWHIPPGATRAENIRNTMSEQDAAAEVEQLIALAKKLAAQGNPVGERTLVSLRAKGLVARDPIPTGQGEGSRTGKPTAWSDRTQYAQQLGVKFTFGMTKEDLEAAIAAKEAEQLGAADEIVEKLAEAGVTPAGAEED